MNYLFGVDGGGSGCRVVLTSTDGKILGKAKGGPANIETSFSKARNNSPTFAPQSKTLSPALKFGILSK